MVKADYLKKINTADIMRPGLEMTGYFIHRTDSAVKDEEWSYLVPCLPRTLSILKKMFYKHTIIVARGLVMPEKCETARECKIAGTTVEQQSFYLELSMRIY